MQLKQLTIYGFGKWQDFKLDLPEDKLIIINGKNESGKSTLRQFCLFILFGLPPKRREFFRPKTGGRMGGRITIVINREEQFVIERMHEKNNGEAVCYLSDGTTRGEEWLKQHLDGVDLETFQSIFSFDAEDLTYLDTIKEEDLGDVLLGIGMAGTNKIYAAEKELENQMNQRFKPQGKNPEINKQLSRLEALQEELTKLQTDERSYREKKITERTLEAEINKKKLQLEKMLENEEKWKRKIQAAPLINQLQHDNAKKAQYMDVNHFPVDGLERYYTWKQKIVPLRSELGVLEENLKKYQRQLTELEVKRLPDQSMKIVEELSLEAGAQKHRLEQLQKKQKMEEHLQHELVSELSELQIGLYPEELSELALPFHLEDEWSKLREEQQELEIELEKVMQEKRTTEQQLQQLKQEKAVLQNNRIPAEKLVQLQKIAEAKNSSEYAPQAGQRHAAKREQSLEQQQKNRRNSNFLLTGSLVVAFLVLLAAVMLELSFLYGAVIVILGFGLAQAAWVRQNIRMMEVYFPSVAHQESVNPATETEQQEAVSVLEEQKLLTEELHTMKDRIQQLTLLDLKLSERSDFCEQKRQLLERKINQQRLEYPFLKQINPAYWTKLYRVLTGCKQLQKQLQEVKEEVQGIKENINIFKQKTRSFLEENGYLGDSNRVDEEDKIKEIVDEQKLLKSNSAQYGDWIEQITEQKQNLLAKIKPYETEVENLWALIPVNTEEDFLKAAERKKTCLHLEERIAACHEKLVMLFPGEKIESFLDNKPEEQWQLERELQEIKKEAGELEKLLEERRQELADIRALLVKMEQSEDYSVISHRFQLEKDQLKEQIRQWAVYRIANQLLEETKQVYQQGYLPEAMKLTSSYFAELTGGKYVHVFPPVEGKTLMVENKEGIRFDVKELSKGARDQLYISLRFTLNEMMNNQYALPFFIDDGFVHFDINRTNQMIEILKRTAKKQQVILFTCQPMKSDHALPAGMQRIELA